MRAKTPQERQQALAKAQRTLEKKLTQMRRLVTSISLWQRRANYYAAQLAMSEEEREEQRREKTKKDTIAACSVSP